MNGAETIQTPHSRSAPVEESRSHRDPVDSSDARVEGAALYLSPQRCYWALLKALPRNAGDEALRYAFEPWLPLPLEDVEARFVTCDGVTIACGVGRARLHDWIESAESNGARVEHVTPSGFPPCVLESLPRNELERYSQLLNHVDFRSGSFESPRRLRRRRMHAATLIVSALIFSGFLSAGMLRRAHEFQRVEDSALAAMESLATGVVGESASASVDPALRLAAEVRRLESTRDRTASSLFVKDAGVTLATLLAAWPTDLRTQVDSIRLDPGLITIRGRVPDAVSAESLANAIESSLNEWSAQSSNLSKGREGYDYSIVWSSLREKAMP